MLVAAVLVSPFVSEDRPKESAGSVEAARAGAAVVDAELHIPEEQRLGLN